MGFMEQAAAKLARKFGTVSEGKHKGCQIALGNDPSKKVEMTAGFEQIIFVDGTEEKGRYNITGDLVTMGIFGHTEDGLDIKLAFKDGEQCQFVLLTEKGKHEGFVATLLKTFLGQKKSNATEEEKKQENFKNIKIFMQNMMQLLSPTFLDELEAYYKENDIMEDLDKSLFKICRKAHQKQEG